MKVITHIETIRMRNTSVVKEVKGLLKWSDLTFAGFQMKMGEEYVKHQFGDDELASQIPNYKEFWSWWKLHWVKRDLDFLDIANMLFENELEEHYRKMHDPYSILFKPHHHLLENTYCAMLHEITKNLLK